MDSRGRHADLTRRVGRPHAGPGRFPDLDTELEPRAREAAVVLRRACHIAPSRDIDLDTMAVAAESITPSSSCYTLQTGVIEIARRVVGSSRAELTDADRPSARVSQHHAATVQVVALQTFSHLGICVRDLELSTRFYEQVLGFKQFFSVDLGSELEANDGGPGLPLHLAHARPRGRAHRAAGMDRAGRERRRRASPR